MSTATTPRSRSGDGTPAAPHNPLPVLVTAVLVVATAQQALIPVLAPLGREVGLSEVAMGVVMTFAAAMFAVTSPLWGRAVDSWGQRPVLLAGLTLSLAGLLGFAVVSQLAVAGRTGGDAMTVSLMVLTRSLVFGAGMGAVPVSAMAWVAANTASTEARIAGISRIGAVQGVAMAVGPALGGMLAFAGLLGPVWAAPVLLALIWVGVAVALPRSPGRTTDPTRGAEQSAEPVVRRRGLRPWDPRLWPVMVVGFAIFLSLGMTMISLGFLVQDRLGVDGAEAVRTAGIVSTAAGVAMVLTQGFLVPRLRWTPWRLLRAGVPATGLSVLTLVAADSLLTLSLGMAGVAFGVGLAAPGYTSSPTLLVGPEEQGSVAGLVQMVTGATFVLGPLVGSALYGIAPPWPFVGAACLCALGTAFVWLRRAPAPPADAGVARTTGAPA